MGPKRDDNETDPPVEPARIGRRRIEWRKIGLLAGALSGIWIAQGVAVWSDNPSAGTPMLLVMTLVLASLVALSISIQSLLSSVRSPLRYVFCGRRLLAFGSFLLVLAVALAGSLVQRNAFHALAAHGRVTATDVADTGFVIAVMVCATGAIVTFAAAWDALRDERAWR